ncbi:MAG: hypothetical protein ACI3V0_03005 [Faecousia sp.]
MNGKDIFLGLKYVGEDLIDEAETARFPVQANQKDTHRKIRRPLLIAALIALTLLLVGCAVVYVLKMEHFKIGEATEQRDYSLVDGVYVEDPHTVNTSTLTLAGVEGSKAYKACADFYAFKEEYTDSVQKAAEKGMDDWNNTAYHDILKAKADEIAAQYGLKPEGGKLEFRTVRNLCDALGVERFVRSSQEISTDINAGSCYDNGNFCLTMRFNFPEDRGYEVLSTAGILYWNRQDCFSRDYVTIVDNGDWVEQNYTTSSGSNVLILYSPSQERGYILCDRGEALMALQLDVNIEILSEDGGVVSSEYQHMTQKQLELVADSLDFAIQPKIPTQVDVEAQAEVPQEATQNGYTLRLKSVETDGYVVRILLGVTAPEGTVLPTEGNVIFANHGGELTPTSGSLSGGGGTTETIDDGDGLENTIDLLLVRDCTMADDSAPFAAGTTWNLHLVDIVYSNWDAANSRLIKDTLAEGEWQFPITFDETNGDYREIELISEPIKAKACIGWGEDGTDALEEFAVTSFKLRKFSSSLQWDLIPDYYGIKDFGSSADFYGWADKSGFHSACVVMKDGRKVDLPLMNKVVDLDQVDYALLPDGTKLPVPEI